MKYTEHQIAVLKTIEDLIQKGAVKIKINKHVFGFGPIIVKANAAVSGRRSTGLLS